MFAQTIALSALAVFWYMLALFVVAIIRRNNTVADIGWGPGFLVAGLLVLWWHEPVGFRPLLVTSLVAIWAMRLAVHIVLRNWGRGEDWRYAAWRGTWGRWWVWQSFARVFLLQGGLLLLVASPLLWVNTYGGPSLGVKDIFGLAIWAIGFCIETVADFQLIRFHKNPSNHGRILQKGLWQYSRHPNYFGEVTQWWGIWIMASSVPAGWITILGPLMITFLITKVSGIPLLEAKYMKNPEFREYAQRVSQFIPWKPKVVNRQNK